MAVDTREQMASCAGCGLPWAVNYLDGVDELDLPDAMHIAGLYRIELTNISEAILEEFADSNLACYAGCGITWLAIPYLDGENGLNTADMAQLAGLFRYVWLGQSPFGTINPSLLFSDVKGVRRSSSGFYGYTRIR